MTRILVAIFLLTAFGTPALAANIVPNTIPCKNFIKNGDGSWTAEAMTRGFDIGNVRNYRLESAYIFAGQFDVGGVDLWKVIEAKCNAFAPNNLSNSVGTFAN